MKKLNRRDFLKVSGVIAAAGALAACGGSSSSTAASTGSSTAAVPGGAADFSDAPQVKLQFAENQSATSFTGIASQNFCDKVKERTNGTVEIEFYPDALLGDEASVLGQVQAGALGMCRANLGAVQAFIPEMGVLTMPYMYKDAVDCWNKMDSEVVKELVEKCADYGFKGLRVSGGHHELKGYQCRSFYAAEPLTTVESLKGKKIRIQESEIVIKMIQCLGGVPTPMTYGEVFQALQTKIIDAAENDPMSYYLSGHYEVAKYYSMDNHQISPSLYVMAVDTWNSMNERQQEAFMECMQEMRTEAADLAAGDFNVYHDKCVEAGCEFLEVDTKPFQEACQGVYDMYPQYAENLARLLG